MPTLHEFADAFLEDATAGNGPAEQRHKRQHLRDHLLDAFGRLRLDRITTWHVDAFAAEKLRTLSQSTVSKLVATLRRALNVAHDWGVIGSVPKFRGVSVAQPEFDFLTFHECGAYLDAADGGYHPLFLVALHTGLRLGELRGLQWGDIDLDRKQLRVQRAYTQTGWGRPKSGHGRTVDLSSDVVATLRGVRPSGAPRDALVFPGPSGKPLDEKAVYKACVTASEGAELGRVIGPHKLRHTFASHHAMRGTPLPQIQAWLGHASITTTMRYAHLCPSQGVQFIDNVSAPSQAKLVDDLFAEASAWARVRELRDWIAAAEPSRGPEWTAHANAIADATDPLCR